MSTTRNVAVLVGSLRQASFSRRVAQCLATLAPETLHPALVGIGALPLYNADDDEGGAPPAPWAEFRHAIKAADAVLFVTPEYNRSVPGALKNAIDVGSRPYGQSVWDRKPAAVMSVSPGAIGGFGANHHLRQSMVFLNMPVMQQPEAYIGSVAGLFAEDDSVRHETTRELFQKFMHEFAAWIERTVVTG